MIWLTHLRTIMIAASAFTFCCGLVTQMMARALGYDAALGPPLLDLGSLRFYAPFSFLKWSLAWASVAPSLLVLSLCLVLVCALAAYAVAIVFAKLEPIALAEPSPWRDLASWRELGHYGLLRDEGLALGAVRRHAWAKYRTVRSNARACAFVGQSQHTDDAVLAALRSWAGSLVLVDARGTLAERLGRKDVLRFAPGRCDAISINPLLALRTGLQAWNDARQLAGAFLANTFKVPQTAIDAFALLMLDQLLCAPLEARTLASLRHRLIDRAALVASLCSRWSAEPKADAAPAIWEMVRVARAQRADPDRALTDFARIDQALAIFADARLASATRAHHLNWPQFISAPTPQTLVLSLENSGPPAASLVQALLAQLATHHSSANDAPPLMLVVEADAARILVEQTGATLPVGPNAKAVIQTADIAQAERLIGTSPRESLIVAIGPQTDASAQSISVRAGECTAYGPIPFEIHRWRRLLLPAWVKQVVERLPTTALKSASPSEAFLVAPDRKPVRMAVLVGGGATRFTASNAAPAPHDWSVPPADAAHPPEALAVDVPSLASPAPAATKLRRVLTRADGKPANKRKRRT
ncbi:MAG: hypothetical protein M0D54_04550 [Hyphomonadaceae bacterium JAD_PAG50586_4]|nr:MAG: hypothetical protein M0D54_04550 [Hyphomonadaceae bacterium JAD_PAG50586_4]